MILNSSQWQIDFTIGYEVEAKLRLNGMDYSEPFEYSAVEIDVTENKTVSDPYGVNVVGGNIDNNWIEKHGKGIALGAGLFAGAALIISSDVLEGISLCTATPVAASLTIILTNW